MISLGVVRWGGNCRTNPLGWMVFHIENACIPRVIKTPTTIHPVMVQRGLNLKCPIFVKIKKLVPPVLASATRYFWNQLSVLKINWV